MSLRTRQGLGLLATVMLIAAACSTTTPATPATGTGTPPAATPGEPTPGESPGEPTPGGSPGEPTPGGSPGEPTPGGSPGEPTPGGSPGEPTPGGSPGEPTPDTGTQVPGGTLILGEWQPADQLNPFYSTAFTNLEAYTPALRGLLTIDNDGNWTPDLATEVPGVDNGGLVIEEGVDGFTLTLRMQPGLLWSDGTPHTLNDFLFTYNWLVDNAINGPGCSGCGAYVPVIDASIEDLNDLYAAENQYVESITVSDDGLEAVVVWRQNYAGWLGWASMPILAEHYFSTIPAADSLTSMPVGPGIELVPWNGPFVITAASAERIDYARNDNWKAGEPAWLDGLVFQYFGSKDGMITAFLNGEIDLALDMTQADFAAIAGADPAIGKAQLDTVWQYEHLDLQNAHGDVGLDDPAVRAAIHQAVNKADLVEVLFPGAGVEPAGCSSPPGTWWRAEDVECVAYDPEAAATALDAAGWPVDEDPESPTVGLRTKDTDNDPETPPDVMRFQMCTSSGNPTRLTTMGKISEYFLALGIGSDIQTADAASVYFAGWASTTPDTQCSIYRGTYDVALFAYVLGGDLYSNYYFSYHSTQIPSNDNPNGSNDTRLSDPEMDEALDALGSLVTQEEQLDAARTVQEVYARANHEIPLYYRAETTGVSVHVGGFTVYNPSSAGPTWNVEDLWFIP